MTNPFSEAIEKVLAVVAPDKDAQRWAAVFGPPMQNASITTPLRIACFLAQVAQETGGLSKFEENLNYSVAALRSQWPIHFAPTFGMPDADNYGRQPEKIANHVYANRYGNGDEKSGDGWRFRGRGALQVTFRDTYTQIAAAVGKTPEETADWMLTPEGIAFSACWVWTWKGCNAYADHCDVMHLTLKINGGQIGSAQRIALTKAALQTLGASVPGFTAPASAETEESETDRLNDAEAAKHASDP